MLHTILMSVQHHTDVKHTRHLKKTTLARALIALPQPPRPHALFRLGKPKPGSTTPRPLKLIMAGKREAIAVLKNKSKLPSSVSAKSDLTFYQRDKLKRLREELAERVAKGEDDITIRVRMPGEEREAYGLESDSEEELVMRPLRTGHCIETQVQPGDTLQAIALRFHCPTSELKRINHIHKDNEIFAHRTIKVPVTPYSVLTEVMPPEPHLAPVSNENLNHDRPPGSGPSDHVIDYNAVIFNSQIAPAVIPYTDAEPHEQPEEDTLLIPPKSPLESAEAVVVKQLTSQGADFGFKWFHLLSCVLLLGVVIPLLYIMFCVDKNEHSDVHTLGMKHQSH